MSKRPFLLIFFLVLNLGLVACTVPSVIKPYRIEIQQGNFLTQEQVDKLRPGMTKEQVRFLLGTPLLVDVFHPDRWDYVYRRQKAASPTLDERRLTLFFESNRLVRTDGDMVPAPAAPSEASAQNGAPQ